MSSSPRPGATRSTLAEVAAAAGVSVATAARALGSYGSVRPETADRVVEAARRLRYSRNGLARSMVTGRTHTLGAVVADIENPFFARAMRAFSDVAGQAGCQVLLSNTDEDVGSECAAVEVLQRRRVDGMLVAPASPVEVAHLHRVHRSGTPLVLLDRALPGLTADSVVIDNVLAGRLATEPLLAAGHRRIAMVTSADLDGPDDPRATPGLGRVVGYRQALRVAGVDVDDALVSTGDFRTASAEQRTHALLAGPHPPTALVTTDSSMTLGALRAVHARGLRIPDDVSLVGIDDADWLPVLDPPVSVVDQPAAQLGALAAGLLLRRLAEPGAPPVIRTLPVTLISRGSVGPPGLPGDH
ncbi:LacI family transcriptional regulator [Planosporangium thailandense]|uniref:LacI family transcriptional regulator n=1 Tax=Planosporangium thailandense TaxID=765197 RepID=A0ABX0XXE9_9ACTN|nr:LacI family DNA-binding transcriptional regulator [Planosporangium thailandense]NJC70724.1 LacI family transcriptional regulator [Planosporangium thailandense]